MQVKIPQENIGDFSVPGSFHKLHVLQVVGDPVGGIRKHIHSIIEGLDEERFCSSYAYSNTFVDTRFQEEIMHLRGVLRGEIPLSVKKKPHPSDLSNLWQLLRFVKNNQVDVVHGHGAKGGLYARIVGMICRVPAIYTPHGGVVHRMFGFWEDKLYTLVERSLIGFTHCFIFESNYTAAGFFSKVGKINRPWLVNYNGIKCLPIEVDQVTKIVVADDKFDIGVFGMLRREKGQAHLINAVASIVNSGHDNVRLHIFGNGPDRRALEKQVHDLGMAGEMTFYGDISNPEQEMSKMNLIVIPSLFESFGYVGIEAMVLGKPVIASAVGGLQEIFNNETALLVTPGDDKALSHAIVQCIQNPESSDAMAQRGYRRCEKIFSLSAMIQILSNQYINAVST